MGAFYRRCIAYLVVGFSASVCVAAPELTIQVQDYATMPITDVAAGKGMNAVYLSRVNFLHEEPGRNRHRLFVNDLNGPLYILDKKTKSFTTYLNFNGNYGQPGLFHKLTTLRGYANGFISFVFDPDYAHNGRFYTIHLEDPALPASPLPDNTNFPGLRTEGYAVTPAIQTPGPTQREAVVMEWTDTNTANTTFEGTARELMRVQLNSDSHPMGGLIFDPTAKRGTPDWRVLYIACGDGRSGESANPAIRYFAGPLRYSLLHGPGRRTLHPEQKRRHDSRGGRSQESVALRRTAPGESQSRLVGESFHLHGQLRPRAGRQPHGE